MNRNEARKAVRRKWPVGLPWASRPERPYIGKLLRRAKKGGLWDGRFLFVGQSENETIEVWVKPEEVFLVSRKSKKEEEKCQGSEK